MKFTAAYCNICMISGSQRHMWQDLPSLNKTHSSPTSVRFSQSYPGIPDSLCTRTDVRKSPYIHREKPSEALFSVWFYRSGDCGFRKGKKKALISLHSQQTANLRIGDRLTTRTEHFLSTLKASFSLYPPPP